METKRIEDKEDVNKVKVKRPDLIIRTDYKLWEYLFKDQQKKAKKLTKAEAYYDIIKKQREALLIQDENYLMASCSEIMEQWGWSRQNVNIFLEDLERIGAITLERNTRLIKFSISNAKIE